MLKKDLIELCLLHLLAQKDQYGYELLRQLRESFPDTQESVIYASLQGLCRDGCSEQYLSESSDGPARKYYRVTAQGKVRCAALLERWRALTAALARLGVQ